MSRVAIIGTGAVGATFAYSLMISGIAEEIVLIDVDNAKAEAEAMDLNHGQSFVKPGRLWSGEYADCGAAEIVVITAGAKQKQGESRLDLVTRNIDILKEIIANIKTSGFKGVLLLVSNPVDVLTYFAWKLSGYDRNKVIGSGTVLDSARFRQLLSQHCEVAPQSVHAYIIGEHGDSEVPAWSLTNIAGVNLKQYCLQCDHQHLCHKETVMDEIFEQVRTSAYKIIAVKGATYYAIGLSLVKIVQAILRDENQVLPISTILVDEYGLNEVALSVPTIVNRTGASRHLSVPLAEKELQALQDSAKLLKKIIASIK